MNKLWVGLLFVLLLALLLAVALTVTFLYKDKKDKDKKKEAKKEVLWTLHLDPEERLSSLGAPKQAVVEKLITIDLAKTEPYTVDGHKITPTAITHKFDKLKVEGYVHRFEKPVRLRKAVVGSNTIALVKIALTSGLSILHKDGGDDFVTLWHDGTFYHYSTAGSLLNARMFPFAEGDPNKSPEKMDLPKGQDQEDVTPFLPPIQPTPHIHPPEPKDDKKEKVPDKKLPEKKEEKKPAVVPGKKEEEVVKKEEDVKEDEKEKKEEEEVVEDEVLEEELFVPTKQPRPGVDVVIDLDNAQLLLNQEKSFVPSGEEQFSVERRVHSDEYFTLMFKLQSGKHFNAKLSVKGITEQLPLALGIEELTLFTTLAGVPLLAKFEDLEATHVLFHRGMNVWTRSKAKMVTDSTLDDCVAFIDRTAIFDLTHEVGEYRSGVFKVLVTEATDAMRRYEGFVCFMHRLVDAESEDEAEALVSKFKNRKELLLGLSKTAKVNTAVVYFSDRDTELRNPLMVRLRVGKVFIDYYAFEHKYFTLETNEEKLRLRMMQSNAEANRIVTLNLMAKENYSFTGEPANKLPFFGYNEMTVKMEKHPSKNHVYKYVHQFKRTFDDEKTFFLRKIEPIPFVPIEGAADLVEVWFLDQHPNMPLVVNIVHKGKNHVYQSRKGEFVENLLANNSVDDALDFSAFFELGFVTLDVAKDQSYHYNGYTSFSYFYEGVVKVETKENTPVAGFTNVRHTVTNSAGKSVPFKLLAMRNYDFGFGQQLVAMNVYYMSSKMTKPLVVQLEGAYTDYFYVWKTDKFVPSTDKFMPSVVDGLGAYVAKTQYTLYLKLDATKDYYKGLVTGYDGVTVTQAPSGTLQKYTHAFEYTKNLILTYDTIMIDATKDAQNGNLFNSAHVYVKEDTGIQFPVFVSLNGNNGELHYKYVGEKKWVKVERSEVSYAPEQSALMLSYDGYVKQRKSS